MMNLNEIQADIEQRMADRGVSRYMRAAEEARQSGMASRVQSVQALLDTALGPVIDAVDDFRAAAKSGRAGRRHSAIAALEGIESGTVAFVGLSSVLDSVGKLQDVTPTAVQIGTTLEREAQMAAVEKEHPVYVKKLMKDLDGRTRNVSRRRAVIAKVVRDRGTGLKDWTRQQQLTVGLKVLELIVQATGMFTLNIRMSGKMRIMSLNPTDRLGAFLGQMDTRFGLMSPEYLPCVIPPKPWTGQREGATRTISRFRRVPTSPRTSAKSGASPTSATASSPRRGSDRDPQRTQPRALHFPLRPHEGRSGDPPGRQRRVCGGGLVGAGLRPSPERLLQPSRSGKGLGSSIPRLNEAGVGGGARTRTA